MTLSTTHCLKKWLLSACCIVLATISFAQNIKGKVVDATTGEPLVGATVSLANTKFKALVRLDGTFVFNKLAPATYTLKVGYAGYKTGEDIVVTVGATGTKTVDFNLESTATELESVSVNTSSSKDGDKGARRIEKIADPLLNILSAKTIQLLPDITVANALQRVSGVTIEKSGSGEGRYPIIRGMEKRYINTLVNGIKIPSPDNKSRYIPLDLFPSELLERLEVSKSLTPSMEGDAIGGTINLVMKDAPSKMLLQVNASTGYNTTFLDQRYNKFDKSSISKLSPAEINGNSYVATPKDFSVAHLNYTNLNRPVNTTFGLTVGNRFGKNKQFGFIVSGSYQNLYRGTKSTFFVPGSSPGLNNVPQFLSLQDRLYSTQNKRVGGSAKVDYQFNTRNKISLYNTYVKLDDYQTRNVIDYNPLNSVFDTKTRSTWQYQSIYNITLQGIHSLTSSLKIDWSLAYSIANNHLPDQTEFTTEFSAATPSIIDVRPLTHLWIHNSDKDLSAYFNTTKQAKWFGKQTEFKTGGLIRSKKRDNFYNSYSLGTNANQRFTTFEKAIFSTNGSVPQPNGNNYEVTENLAETYLQVKIQINKKLEALAGVRVESTNQNYATQFGPEVASRSGRIWYTDVLPSVQLKYAITKKEALRFAYYKALARPSFADIIPDGTQGDDFFEKGNPDNIKHTIADNFDVRYEYFPGSADQVLLGVFYKNIKDPIEYSIVQGINTSQAIQPVNWGNATNYGLEAVVTKYIGAFGISANYTYTKSQITTTKRLKSPDPLNGSVLQKDTTQTRPLQGQSNNVGNISLLYKNTKIGLDVQVALVYTGERLIQVNPYYNFDYWQSPTTQLDISFEKRFLKKFSFYGKLTNLTDAPTEGFIRQPYTIYIAKNPKVPLTLQRDPENKIYVQKSNFKPTYLFGIRFKL